MTAAQLRIRPVDPLPAEDDLELFAEGVVGTDEACRFLACSRTMLYHLLYTGRVVSVSRGRGCKRLIPVVGMRRYLASLGNPVPRGTAWR